MQLLLRQHYWLQNLQVRRTGIKMPQRQQSILSISLSSIRIHQPQCNLLILHHQQNFIDLTFSFRFNKDLISFYGF